MKCEPTRTAAPDEIDIGAIKEKYRQERDKRIRPEGQKQYVKTEEDFASSYQDDPHTPVQPRGSIVEDLDVAILGAGFSGTLAGVHLRNAGVKNFRHIEHAGDFGGVWYWNRYPGIQCDNDAYCYMPMLEETGYIPSKKFCDGFEIQAHCKRIATTIELYPRALFHTLVTSLRWDESLARWRISTNRGDDIRARFVLMCGGPLNRPKLPGIPGMQDFSGKLFHTARWDYAYTGGNWETPNLEGLADKRVAIIGTGASAVQAIPYLGRYAKQLYVLQRTPSSVDKRPNPPTDPEWAKTLSPGWQKQRQSHFNRIAVERFGRGEVDQICDIWTEINRNVAAKLDAQGWPDLSLEDYLAMREVEDFLVMERMRRRVDEIVKNKSTAELLKPWYRFLCKRPCSNDNYYETFNRPNVALIDVSASQGVERMTPRGFVASGVEYEIDCLICASGFEVTSDLDRRWGIRIIEGRHGKSLYDHWSDGYVTLHGAMTCGFPNQFFTGYLQGGFNATTTEQFGRQGFHIAYIIKEALQRGAAIVEPTQQAQDAWVSTIRNTAFDLTQFQRDCTPGYFNNEGSKKVRWYLGESYGPGWDAFERLTREWRENGTLDGLILVTNPKE
jgi:cyclohexanone monooxygenase